MLKNYFTIALRNMVRNKLFTAINILGLSVSIACCLLLFLYVSEQLGYDNHHGENVYRVTAYITQKGGSEIHAAHCSVPVAPAIQAQIPEVEEAARVLNTELFGKDIIDLGEDSYYIKGGAAADASIFDILKYDIIAGNPNTPLPHPNAVVLEKEWAEKLFASDNAVGKSVKISTGMGVTDYEITAVYDKDSYNTHLTPSFIISLINTGWHGFIENLSSQWVTNNLAATYVRLQNGTSAETVVDKIDQIFRKNGAEDMKAYGMDKKMALQPIADIHTNDSYFESSGHGVSLTFIHVLIAIGVLILTLACVNYINLSTAKASNRALEVGVRKVMGISSKGLIGQFLGESFIVVLISLIISFCLASLTLPIFNQLVDQPIALDTKNTIPIIQYMIIFLFVTSFAAGIYPAVYLSSFKPTVVLKGKNKDKGSAAVLRKVLVIGQFVISIVLISAILVISDQVDFIKNKDLGFQPDSKIVIPLANDLNKQAQVLKDRFKTLAEVSEVGGGNNIPGEFIFSDIFLYKSGETVDDAVRIYQNWVDEDYIKALDMNLIAGRNFKAGMTDDSLSFRIIINHEAAAQFGFTTDDAIGQTLHNEWNGTEYAYRIVGVIDDINQTTLHKNVEPTMLVCGNGQVPQLVVKANTENYATTKANLQSIWKEIIPNTPFEAFLLNDHIIKQYHSDFKTFNLIKYFAIISIFISCMGLYALSVFVAERRFKEIGVRKVLGANIKNILVMVSKDLSLLIIIAFVLSVPISFYVMNIWLSNFAYKVDQRPVTYVIAGLATILIAWITIGYQSIKAARTNPVEVLKDE
ncbi:ABC transporter permease [Fulvivirga sediminis]|uniref:ABC transporter permease n=1 Tax=Fulvivirga sediminis TaxID=2803949 RepID=A0A937K2D9_9BACT|nr:ABC transporter permease [Fulvivirga sediminis]MBL3658270.1 ABC transporter permease [Fulvivirga sediminis]